MHSKPFYQTTDTLDPSQGQYGKLIILKSDSHVTFLKFRPINLHSLIYQKHSRQILLKATNYYAGIALFNISLFNI